MDFIFLIYCFLSIYVLLFFLVTNVTIVTEKKIFSFFVFGVFGAALCKKRANFLTLHGKRLPKQGLLSVHSS